MSTPDAFKTKAINLDGRKVSLASLPLVAFKLSCGHVGKDYAINKSDVIFCETCATNMRVNKIISF